MEKVQMKDETTILYQPPLNASWELDMERFTALRS